MVYIVYFFEREKNGDVIEKVLVVYYERGLLEILYKQLIRFIGNKIVQSVCLYDLGLLIDMF